MLSWVDNLDWTVCLAHSKGCFLSVAGSGLVLSWQQCNEINLVSSTFLIYFLMKHFWWFNSATKEIIYRWNDYNNEKDLSSMISCVATIMSSHLMFCVATLISCEKNCVLDRVIIYYRLKCKLHSLSLTEIHLSHLTLLLFNWVL